MKKDRRQMKRIVKGEEGSALIVAMVIMLVLVTFSLLLLLASYSLFSTANRQGVAAQCRELALTVSETLGEQVTEDRSVPQGGSTAYTAEEFYAKLGEGTLEEENPLWYYLRFHLFQGDVWPYTEDGETPSGDQILEYGASFSGADGDIPSGYGISVSMYWISDGAEALGNGSDTAPYRDASPQVCVTVTCEKDEEAATVTSVYVLSAGEFASDAADGTETEKTFTDADYGTTIYCRENWKFTLLNRK